MGTGFFVHMRITSCREVSIGTLHVSLPYSAHHTIDCRVGTYLLYDLYTNAQ